MSINSRGRSRRGSAVAATAMFATALIAITGCAGGGSSSPSPSSSTELVSVGPAAKGPTEKIVWNLPTGEPSTLDPRNAPTYSGANVVSNLCDSLLTIDAEYNTSPNIVEPEQVTPTELKLTVRDGATFWDGSPVTAEDVAFSLQRSADPAALVSFIYANVDTIAVTGPTEVTVTFTQPDEMFITEMTTFAGMVVQKAFAEAAGDTFGSSSGGLMCSGPFVFQEWVPGDHITMTKNPDYWNADRIPLTEAVEFVFVADSSAYTQAMKTGEINGSYEITPSAIPALQEADGNLYFGPSTQSVVLSVANPGGVFEDVQLREAFQTLVDRDALADVVYNGAATPLYTVVGPGQWQNDAREVYAEAAAPYAETRAFDPDKSKAAIEASNYDGEEIVMVVPSGDATLARVAQLVQEQAKQASVTITISSLQPLEYAEAQYDASKRVGIDLILGTSWSAVRDPLESTGFLFLPGAFYNQTEFDDPEVTELLETARQTFDPVERAEMFVQAQEIYEAASTIMPLLSTSTVTYLSPDLAGAVTSFAYMTMPALATVGSAE